MPHMSIRITEKERADYKDLAEHLDKSLSEIVKDYLDRLLKRTPIK